MAGPLHGVTVIEIVGLGPGPFCGMLLADLGADVIRIDRVDPGRMFRAGDPSTDVMARSRRSVAVDLKRPEGVDVVLRLAAGADALFEGMRPGVAERLGIGPEAVAGANPAIVYGRMTGWGQDGPWAQMAGHDIDYIALTGMLGAIGRAGGPPVPPLNLLGDFGGGGLMLAFGIVAGILHARATGEGQVVDAAMVDGASVLGSMVFGLAAAGGWTPERGTNLLDTGAPFYDVYETSDGRHVGVGAIEPQFFAALVAGLGLPSAMAAEQWDRSKWEEHRVAIAAAFATADRDTWAARFEGTDACVAPVLTYEEAPAHPHLAARGTFVDVAGVTQPAPAPRFDRTPTGVPRPPVAPGADTDAVLADAGFDEAEVTRLRELGAID